MTDLFFILTFIAYFVAFIGFGFYFKTLRKDVLKYAQFILGSGFIFHSIFWIFRILEIYSTNTLYFKDLPNFLAWCLILIYFIFSFSRLKIYTVGFFISPFVLIFLFISYIISSTFTSPFTPYFRNFWFPIHAISGLLSHGFLIFAMVTSIMYLLQEREIKRKHLGIFYRKLPPLEYLDRVSEKCVYLGFLFLSIAIITGAIWSNLVYAEYWRWSPKEVNSFILWLIYAILIHQRILIGWRGKKSAFVIILGFGVWLISFFVINLFTKGFHTYVS